MSNVPCNRPDFCRPFRAMVAGELTQAKARYVFSARHTARRAKITQPRVYPGSAKKNVPSPERAPETGNAHGSDREPISCHTQRPLQGLFWSGELTQGKPWAMLSWPFGPLNHRGAWRFLTRPFLRFKRSPRSAREISQILLSLPAC
jgi:hypothetical protein